MKRIMLSFSLFFMLLPGCKIKENTYICLEKIDLGIIDNSSHVESYLVNSRKGMMFLEHIEHKIFKNKDEIITNFTTNKYLGEEEQNFVNTINDLDNKGFFNDYAIVFFSIYTVINNLDLYISIKEEKEKLLINFNIVRINPNEIINYYDSQKTAFYCDYILYFAKIDSNIINSYSNIDYQYTYLEKEE